MTPLTDFLQHILADWVKRSVENDIGEDIDNVFFNKTYSDSIERWSDFYNVESAYSFYQEASEEIKSEWFGRYSQTLMDRSKSNWSDMDDDQQQDFLNWILGLN